jgi:Flp pilus assembly protein TadD
MHLPPVLRRALAASLVLAALAGCSGHGDASKVPPPEVRAQQLIDAGNDAYKKGDYREAARRYAAAAVVNKQDPAAYYGMAMALSKLGRDDEARAAYARAKVLSTGK